MKKLSFLIAFLVVGLAQAAPKDLLSNSYPTIYGEPFIFVERGVEFAVFPDGQFDFFYNPRGFSLNVSVSNVNISYNAGYNYDPFIQYDDYGAVIQIENVPIYYDYYGRIIQAGSVRIAYNQFGQVARIGGLYIHYNPHNQYTHYSGFINRYNKAYFYRPWHRYYVPPHAHQVIVYNQPYRAHYYPSRVSYTQYRTYYQTYNTNGFKKRYYNPGDNAVVYHRGRRTENRREIRASYPAENTGSNMNTRKETAARTVNSPVRNQSTLEVRNTRRTLERPSNEVGTSSGQIQERSTTFTRRSVQTRESVSRNSTPNSTGNSSVARDTRNPSSAAQRSSGASTVKRSTTSSSAASTRSAGSRSARGRE